ncbi:bromodomain-containing protein 4A isoform X2 [Dendroctonus ponderosae]|uniref:bromodomain-containing protein 4A isoform X2 n=1 Tax=Dendroctonus ponderosae TaxID=77166 RepID=UPI002034D81D|nr:bromodomain-containing protein 4A isoform X2 [Dendroctonus ponderosae]
MFPTFISILDIQSWWEVPSIAHFCSLFRTAFNLLDFDIEDLEEALLTDGTEETSWLQELIVRLLSGCLPNNEISTFNYQMFLRRLFRQKCQEHDRYNPFNTDCDFTLLPLRTKVDILHALCDFRLDAEDVLDQLKNLEADSLRVEPLGFDKNESAYWYFYGTRLYREDFERKNNKKKAVWQVICFTEDDWFQLTKKFKSSGTKNERLLHHTLSKNFLPELPRLFKEKERQARRRLLENQPRRTSDRIRKLDADVVDKEGSSEQLALQKDQQQKKKEQDERRRDSYENRSKLKECTEEGDSDRETEIRNEMASKKKVKTRQRQPSTDSETTKAPKRKKSRLCDKNEDPPPVKLVGRQTNNSLSALDGQIVIQQAAPPASSSKKKLKPSQVFQQTDEDLLVGMHKILDYVKNHEDAWPFVDPVEEEYAPNYYSIIRRPMDLTKMEERLDQGYYKGYDKFKGDFQLIVNNCRLYNGAENEYTLMVDNLVTVFDKATERFLDQISSSDEEVAVENLECEDGLEDNRSVKSLKKKKRSESPPRTSSRTIKPGLTAQGKKRERASSHESAQDEQSEPKTKKNKKQEKPLKADHRKNDKVSKKPDKGSRKPDKQAKKPEKQADAADDRQTKQAKGSKSKKENRPKSKDKKAKKRSHKKKKSGSMRPSSCSKSSTPSIRSAMSSPPPSSPEDSQPMDDSKLAHSTEDQSKNAVKFKKATFPWELTYFPEDPPPAGSPAAKDEDVEDTAPSSPQGFSFKPAKDKHNKLRETIEKLKANSEINRLQSPVCEFEADDQLKENKDKNKKSEESSPKAHKEKPKAKRNNHHHHQEQDGGKSAHQPDVKRPAKKSQPRVPEVSQAASKQSNLEALSLATEQTLKDINKWLDDTPKFDDFSSASNSPSYMTLEEFDLLGAPRPMDIKKVEKVAMPAMTNPAAAPPIKRDGAAGSAAKEGKKKPFRDPSKFFGKRREIQRTIDRLQPGKSKGNLITNVQGASKSDEIFPLGALNKIKDAKNSLIVKTDTNAPKLSLGSVLDSFGKHKFVVDDQKKDEEESRAATAPADTVKEEDKAKTGLEAEATKEETKELKAEGEVKVEKEVADAKPSVEPNAGGPTPNLSAWFKAFGTPKAPPPQKKPDKADKAEEAQPVGAKSERVPPADPSPSLEGPQPVARVRRISTGSSVSERSSFSQDLDSPRVGVDERGAYLVPYPSPLYRSPSTGASPVTASPRPDISPRSPYPFNGGQIRVGFYQDTAASSKSSPDKSCSPRENPPNSPFYQPGSEHVYAPNTTQSSYSGSYTATNPYYTHPPSYSSTNPTPPYNMDSSSNAYYDTKIADHYQAKPSQNYTANSPASSQNSPAAQPMLSPHSPMVHLPQASPSIHSPNVQSPSMHSHSPQMPSPAQSLHSPGMSVVSPQVVSSPGVQHSPSMSVHSPLNPVNMESFHSQPDETSNCQVADHKDSISNVQQHQVFPVKKRAFLDSELSSQFVALQDEMANRGLQQMSSEQMHLQLQQQEQYQKQQMQEAQKHHMQEIQVAQEHIRQQAQLQQQKNQFIMQQQQQKNQQALQEQQKAQQQQQQHQQQLLQEQKTQQLLQEQKQQQQLLQQQQQKNIQLLQHQAMAVFGKVASSDQSLRTPSPQSLSHQGSAQQLPGHSEPSAAIRSMSYPTSTSTTSSHPYGASFSGRDGYALNVANSRAMQPPHQPKQDMSKFTNMGYSGPDVNFSRSLQQQYARPELSYTRTTVQSPISQASQLLNSQSLIASQPSASSVTSLPGYQKPLPNQQQAHSATYQSGRAVDSVAERLAAQVQQDVSGYKQEARNSYNSAPLDLEQALGLSRNLSNMVDRYSNEQRMMASLQSAPGSYYNDKALSTSHMFNKQIFSQSNMAAMSYSHQQQQQQQQQTLQQQSLYGRQLNAELQPHDLKPSMPAAPPAPQEKKQRKKKGSSKGSSTDSSASSLPAAGASSQSGAGGAPSHGFQSYAGLKTAPVPTGAPLDPASIALKSASVPGSAFNFGTGGLGMGSGLPESYPNVGLLDEFRGSANYLMCGTNAKPGQTGQSYPPFLNPAAHQGRGAAYPLGGPFMDTSSQLYQHYLQAGVLNQGLLGATSGYPPGYHAAALAMRQPYDSMSRHSWL